MLRSFFLKNFLSSRNNLRLRLVHYLGTIMEKQAEAFYRLLGEQTDNNEIKRLCDEIAGQEKSHQTLIESELARWKPYPVIQMEIDVLDADKRFRNLFLTPPVHHQEFEEIVRYIIDQEKNMVAFYAEFETDLASHQKLYRLKDIIKEEKEHLKKWSEFAGYG